MPTKIEQEALDQFVAHWLTMDAALHYLDCPYSTLDHYEHNLHAIPCAKLDDGRRVFARSDLDVLKAKWEAGGGRRRGRPYTRRK